MSKYDTQTPYTASYIVFEKDGKYAFVLRRNTGWMDDHYSLPSGKVEQNEAFSACAIREAKEEAGVDIEEQDLQYLLTMHRFQKGQKNWVDVYFVARKWSGEVHNAEPEKSHALEWFEPSNLPENIIPDVRTALEQIQQGIMFYEYGWTR